MSVLEQAVMMQTLAAKDIKALMNSSFAAKINLSPFCFSKSIFISVPTSSPSPSHEARFRSHCEARKRCGNLNQ